MRILVPHSWVLLKHCLPTQCCLNILLLFLFLVLAEGYLATYGTKNLHRSYGHYLQSLVSLSLFSSFILSYNR